MENVCSVNTNQAIKAIKDIFLLVCVHNQLSYGLIPLHVSEYGSNRSEQRERYPDCAFVIVTRRMHFSQLFPRPNQFRDRRLFLRRAHTAECRQHASRRKYRCK